MARATISGLEPEKKRKRKDGVSHASKKSRTVAVDPPQGVDFQDHTLQLEEKILESRTNYNSIHTLLEYLHKYDGAEDEDTIAAVALCRVFCRLMAGGNLSKSREKSGNEATIAQWLRERMHDYEQGLLRILGNENIRKQCTALTIVMRLFKEKASHLNRSEDAVWQRDDFIQIVQTLIGEQVAEETRAEFVEKYVEKYYDVRYYTFACLAGLASKRHPEALVQNTLTILAAIKSIPEQQEGIEDFYVEPPIEAKHDLYSSTVLKKQAQKAWMALLRQDLSKSQRKTILDLLSHRIAPWFLKVELLMDFLTDSFNFGGSTSLLALAGLFYLIQRKNLDYSQFYHKLYSLLDSNILHSKHRSGIFRLLDTLLASTHLPAALVASFIKRLARLTLFAPPSGIVATVPWIYNLLKSHPSCTFMIHKNGETDHDKETWGDPFRQDESDPMETDALESSLWEIQMLQSHYHPSVATIAKIISEQFTKQTYNLEDFLDHSYGTMLEAGLSKDVKKPPETEYEIPKKIFMKYDAESGNADSWLVKHWKFN
ncbi:MAG: hypothetical protein ASARMPRED_000394 [Alectoria sarmentosa]|nr:MAG: hypothetical protein ASARMPRED_000394 [Alectoria sarmentosa]